LHLCTLLAVAAAKAALKACHLAGRPGSSLPGRAALKIDSHIIAPLAAQVRRGIIVTCGTNGKTTTNNLLCSALEAQGFRVVSNRLGANMKEGVAAALATAAGPLGLLDADYACLEIDEASAVHILPYLQPDHMIITNLFRDQLDRYGEIDLTMKALEEAIRLAPSMTLVINGDDPLTAFLAKKSGRRFASFGVSEKVAGAGATEDVSSGEVRESRFCENCGAPLKYEFYHFSQLGVYHCPSCGFGRPAINYDASGVRLSPELSLDVIESGAATVDSSSPQKIKPAFRESTAAPVRISAPMAGFYNVYNILAVYSVLRELRLPADKLNEVLRDYKPQFGRGEVFHVGQNSEQKILLNLAKNPAGFNQNITAMLQDRSSKDLIIVINDNAQDGRDVSWLWDVDFDRLADDTIRSITVSGLRALDMQLRLKYVEIESVCAPTVEKAIARCLADGCGNLYVLVNYTALYEAHQYLEGIQK
jgi:UDP-N-acetylmuramyl tripeptide synthase